MHCLLVLPMFIGVLGLSLERTPYWYRCIVYWCFQCVKGVCVCFLQRLSIGIDALFIGSPNVCRGFVPVSCNNSLLV